MARKRKSTPGPYIRHLEMMWDRVQNRDEYPYNLPAIRSLVELKFHPQMTFLVGENGSGKSTLLEAIAVAYGLNAEGGSHNFTFSTRSSHSALFRAIRLAKEPTTPADSYFVRAESFYNLATEVERLGGLSYGDAPLHEQSHGESFFALFENRLGNHGLYLMDEPEAALSPTRQIAFLSLLRDLIHNGSQLVIATHSPIIMAYPGAWIYHLNPNGMQRIEYEETDHYRLTHRFLSSPQSVLARLFEGQAPSE